MSILHLLLKHPSLYFSSVSFLSTPSLLISPPVCTSPPPYFFACHFLLHCNIKALCAYFVDVALSSATSATTKFLPERTPGILARNKTYLSEPCFACNEALYESAFCCNVSKDDLDGIDYGLIAVLFMK
jgi:hypothetical protein